MKGAIRILAGRELWSAAVQPSTWATLAAAWLLLGYAFTNALPAAGGDLRDATLGLFASWWWVQFFLAPLLCMRSLSEERRTGTFESLMTAPVRDRDVVVAKFLAAWSLTLFAALACPLLLCATTPFGGRPDPGQLLSAYLGSAGTGAVLCAIGVFASALTASQIFAAFFALVLNTALAALPGLAAEKLAPDHVLTRALSRGSLSDQLREASAGVLDLNHVAFQIAISAVFLLFATRALESRKWR